MPSPPFFEKHAGAASLRGFEGLVADVVERIDGDRLATIAGTQGIEATLASAQDFLIAERGAPPQSWRAWFRLCNAMGEVLSAGSTLTRAAHEAGFSDSAHLTRCCKQLMGVSPAMMMPQTVYFSAES